MMDDDKVGSSDDFCSAAKVEPIHNSTTEHGKEAKASILLHFNQREMPALVKAIHIS